MNSLITNAEKGRSLIDWLCSRFSYYGKAEWTSAIEEGRILINGCTADVKAILRENDTVEFTPEKIEEPYADLSYDTIYESADYAVLSKPAHLPVHPSGRYFNNTLWALLKERWGWFHFCTRLDRETSGLMLVALSKDFLHRWLKISDQTRRDYPIVKEYSALCFGEFKTEIDARGHLVPDSGSIVRKKLKFILEDKTVKKDSFTKGAPWCRTVITPVDSFPAQTLFSDASSCPADYSSIKITLVRCRLFTGRTHQIRATLFGLGFPVVGDKLYGPDESIFLRFADGKITETDQRTLILNRQALHCEKLAFPLKAQTLEYLDPPNFNIRSI